MELELRRKITLLERATSIEQSAIRTSLRIAVAVFVAGLIGAFLVHKLAPAELGTAKFALTICTGLGSFMAGIPIKDVFSKRLKIECISFLKSEYQYAQETPAGYDPQRMAEIEKRFWNLIDKNV